MTLIRSFEAVPRLSRLARAFSARQSFVPGSPRAHRYAVAAVWRSTASGVRQMSRRSSPSDQLRA